MKARHGRSDNAILRRCILLIILILCAIGVLSSCSVKHYAMGPGYAGPAPPTTEVAERFGYEKRPIEATLEIIEEKKAFIKYIGRFRTFCPVEKRNITVTFWFFKSLTDPDPRPAVVLLPILAGNYGLVRRVGPFLAGIGISSIAVLREGEILDPARNGEDIENLLRKTVINTRKAIDWLVVRDDIDSRRIGSLGVSLGGIGISLLLAVEQRPSANIVVMAGGDLPAILMESSETKVWRYRRGRLFHEKLTVDELRRELEESIRSDPLSLAKFVDARNLLFVMTKYDDKVPTRYQEKLWEAFGKPEAYILPTGHYTAILFASFGKEVATDFYFRRFGLKRHRMATRNP